MVCIRVAAGVFTLLLPKPKHKLNPAVELQPVKLSVQLVRLSLVTSSAFYIYHHSIIIPPTRDHICTLGASARNFRGISTAPQ